MKITRCPARQARIPKAIPKWVLPVTRKNLLIDGCTHPVTLRIRAWRPTPDGVLIDANDGDNGPMTFRLWTLRDWKRN